MRSHEARPLTENEKKRLVWVCQRLNVDIDFDYQGVGDGVYLPAENGRRARISLSAAPLEPYKFVFKHELAHHLQTAKGYAQTRKALLDSPVFTDWLQQKYGSSIVQARMAVIERYRQQGVTLDLTEATDELVADFFADCAFDGLDGEIDNQFLDRLAADEPNLFKRLWNAIKDLVEKLRGMFYFKDMSDVERRFETLARRVQAGQTESTAKNGGARYSIATHSAIDLSNDNELSQRIGNKRGSEKYKEIQNYILEVLAEQPITLSDGKKAVVDRSDAQHIASKAGNKKTAHISAIKELIETAVIVAEEKSTKQTKFDHFYYYETCVKMGDDIYPLYLNVGRARNDFSYHIYDITQKIRDTAHRLNGVWRPVGYAMEAVSLNKSISNRSEKVNTKYSIPSDEGAAAEDRQSAAQQTAADIVDAFNKGDIDSEAALGRMADLFGRMKPGKKNNVDVVMPQSVDGQKKVRRLTQSIIETGLLPKSAADTLQGGIVQGDYS